MPFLRPTLSELQNQAAQDIVSNLDGGDALLRYSNLNVLANVQAGMAHLQMGYLDYISLQCTPATATDEFLEAWGALKNISREPIAQATGTITFAGTKGANIPIGTEIKRGDGMSFVVTVGATVTNSRVTVSAKAVADPEGIVGSNTNCVANLQFTLLNAIPGISSSSQSASAFAGGADIEKDADLRTRILLAYQKTPQGGSAGDYELWAQQVQGVTRAWAYGSYYGAGTVVVFVMLDNAEAASNGFPVGTNGTATLEKRDENAAGDQLAVANFIYPLQPVTALVYVCAPEQYQVDFSITGVSATYRDATTKAIEDLLKTDSNSYPGGYVIAQKVWAAISSITANSDFLLTSPAADIALPAGSLPVLGEITWS